LTTPIVGLIHELALQDIGGVRVGLIHSRVNS